MGRSPWYFQRNFNPTNRQNVERSADPFPSLLPDGPSSQPKVIPTIEGLSFPQNHHAREVNFVAMSVGFGGPDVTTTIGGEPIAATIAATKTKDISIENNSQKDIETTSNNTGTPSKQRSGLNPKLCLLDCLGCDPCACLFCFDTSATLVGNLNSALDILRTSTSSSLASSSVSTVTPLTESWATASAAPVLSLAMSAAISYDDLRSGIDGLLGVPTCTTASTGPNGTDPSSAKGTRSTWNLLDISALNNETSNSNSTTTISSSKATSPPTIPTSVHASTSSRLSTTRTTAETSISGNPLDTLVPSVDSLLSTSSPGAGSVGQVSTALILNDSILQSTPSGLFATLTLGDSTTTIIPTPQTPSQLYPCHIYLALALVPVVTSTSFLRIASSVSDFMPHAVSTTPPPGACTVIRDLLARSG
ncbi:hypothetical protein N7537_010494 [Penicillium hordei]|uniref:Uncharacterized protein n=1 Tax=Penicillium hordei TaxID=40994 RepID=A0AAD6DVG1_9EURO|nr:uncharacterized protein N7537_010494 [Penicillium hordei]KAJ5593590.1 hypothetical protein N7537_010494 [Penicillium hordei]